MELHNVHPVRVVPVDGPHATGGPYDAVDPVAACRNCGEGDAMPNRTCCPDCDGTDARHSGAVCPTCDS